MLRRSVLIFLSCLFVFKIVWAADPEKVGLFLSFEQRLALSYALLAQGETEDKKEQIVERAKSYFKKMASSSVKTVKVRNFQEFLTAFKGAWPDTQSLELDIAKIEKAGARPVTVFTSDSESVRRQINRYELWQQEQLLKMAVSDQARLEQTSNRLGEQVKAFIKNPRAQKAAEMWLLSESESVLADRMKELDRVGEKIAESGFAKQQDATMRIFMQTMFSEYFSRLNPGSKKLIVSSFLGGNLYADDMKKFEIMVQNSGPQLQKLLQVVARQADLPPEVLEVFRGLENSVRPVPWNQVEEILAKEKGNYKFTYFERKPLGVGTMAQVHRAKIEVNGERKDVVVRFIKPGISDRVAEDKAILTEVAKILDNNPEFRRTGAPKLEPVVNDITSTVIAELSQEDTIARQKMAKTRYEKTVLMKTPEYKTDIEFHVPDIYEPKGKTQFMVQEMVIGRKLDKEVAIYTKAIPQLKKAVVEEISKVWAREVMFGGGFYHSDLHQGNFMLNVVEPKIQVHILDFGMGGTISAAMQRQVMVLAVGTDILSPELIARSFWALSEKNKNSLSEVQFTSMVQEKVKRIRLGLDVNPSPELWTAWAMDNGLKLPYEFVSLNRGMVIVNKLLSDSGSKLTLVKIMKSLAKSNATLVYRNLVIEEKVSMKDLARLGWSEFKAMVEGDKTQALPMTGVVRCEAVF